MYTWSLDRLSLTVYRFFWSTTYTPQSFVLFDISAHCRQCLSYYNRLYPSFYIKTPVTRKIHFQNTISREWINHERLDRVHRLAQRNVIIFILKFFWWVGQKHEAQLLLSTRFQLMKCELDLCVKRVGRAHYRYLTIRYTRPICDVPHSCREWAWSYVCLHHTQQITL